MQWCCQTWVDLGQELSDEKRKSLQKLIAKGIPRSTFSPISRILESISNFCPMCGCKIGGSTVTEVVNQVSVTDSSAKPKNAPSKETVSASPPTIKCPPCRGKGTVSDGVNCMTCLGTGVLDKGNPHRRQYDPVFNAEFTEKMDKITSKIVEKEKEIEKNPQPLRDDAKPENWSK